ncbi:MAG: transposase [Gemmatimonadales bacterium]
MVAEARRDPAWPVLRAIPFLGPGRVALLLAPRPTPGRFRTKRHLWAYAGLAVVTRSTGDYLIVAGQPGRRRRAPLTRGLTRNHHRILKDVVTGAATAASARPGPLQDFYHALLARGLREELARVTLARQFAALPLRLWKKGAPYDPSQVTRQAQ